MRSHRIALHILVEWIPEIASRAVLFADRFALFTTYHLLLGRTIGVCSLLCAPNGRDRSHDATLGTADG